jgi:hypothetical protein
MRYYLQQGGITIKSIPLFVYSLLSILNNQLLISPFALPPTIAIASKNIFVSKVSLQKATCHSRRNSTLVLLSRKGQYGITIAASVLAIVGW